MNKLKKQAYTLFCAFDKTFNNKWGTLEVACEYCIQLGHLGIVLSQDKLIDLDINNIKEPKRNLHNISDELSDCLLQLLTLCTLLKITPVLKKQPAINFTQNYGQLIIMAAQIADSTMIINKRKFALNRNEKEFISSRINKSFNIIITMFSSLGYDHQKEFIKMTKATQLFLNKRKNQNER